MPWKIDDVSRFTKAADTYELKALWVRLANAMIQDGVSEKEAIATADKLIDQKKENNKKWI